MPGRPRFEQRPQQRVVTREQFSDGFDVFCCGRYMKVGYRKLAQYNDGTYLVEEPYWRDQP